MFKPKDQIAYIPSHVERGDINDMLNHPDVEFGFVFSCHDDSCFCRFWLKDQPGVLRTTSCSEKVYNHNLIKHISYNQEKVTKYYNTILAANKLRGVR